MASRIRIYSRFVIHSLLFLRIVIVTVSVVFIVSDYFIRIKSTTSISKKNKMKMFVENVVLTNGHDHRVVNCCHHYSSNVDGHLISVVRTNMNKYKFKTSYSAFFYLLTKKILSWLAWVYYNRAKSWQECVNSILKIISCTYSYLSTDKLKLYLLINYVTLLYYLCTR